jgi:hypothetical protein
MKELLLKHIIEIIFCIITGTFTFYLQKLKYELQQYKYIQSSLKALLKDRFTQAAYHFIELGYINQNELENVTDLHTQYVLLGGNSYTNLLFDKIKQLPIKD